MSYSAYPITYYQMEVVDRILPVFGTRAFTTVEVTNLCGYISPSVFTGLKKNKVINRVVKFKRTTPSVYQFRSEFITWYQKKKSVRIK